MTGKKLGPPPGKPLWQVFAEQELEERLQAARRAFNRRWYADATGQAPAPDAVDIPCCPHCGEPLE